jgi:predicted O-methyltransferase YrrM
MARLLQLSSQTSSTLHRDPLRGVLRDLYRDARRDRLRYLKVAARVLTGRGLDPSRPELVFQPQQAADLYLAGAPALGQLYYTLARLRRATRIVEYGASLGLSTLHLAAAVRDNGGGRIVTTELVPSKCATALANLERAGLADLVEIRLGDARETLAGLNFSVDLLLLDGWTSEYMQVLRVVEPALAEGALIVAAGRDSAEFSRYVEGIEASEGLRSSWFIDLDKGLLCSEWHEGGRSPMAT